MENKRKIWVRVAAFMAAIICCVICVIPAYAADGETTQEELAATIEEQEEKLNRMLRPFGYELDYSAYLLAQSKTYADIVGVGEIDSDFPTYGIKNTDWANDSIFSNFAVWVELRNSANELVWSRSQLACEWIGLSIPATSQESNLTLRYGGGKGQTFRMYFDPNGNWLKFRVDTSNSFTDYLCSDGYHFSCFFISTDLKYNPYLKIVCSRNWSVDPSMLLSLDVSAGNDEIYNQGYAAGYQFGFEEGEMHGLEEGLDRGREEGFAEGRADGYRTGYDDGMNQTSFIEGIKSLFRAPMEFVESALDFEIFDINMASAVKVIITAMMIAFVVFVVWKAVK